MKVQGILVSPNEFISVELFLILTLLAERDRSCHVTIFVHDIFLKLVIFKPFFSVLTGWRGGCHGNHLEEIHE